jgi:hypothetical protein
MSDSKPEPPIGQPHGEPESGVSESEGLIPGRFSSGETCRFSRSLGRHRGLELREHDLQAGHADQEGGTATV